MPDLRASSAETLDPPVQAVRLQAAADVMASPLGDGVALLDLRSNQYFSLNAVGAALWQALARPRSINDLCDAVADDFEVASDACRADVRALLGDLQRHGLVVATD